jgi:hypothetical protein
MRMIPNILLDCKSTGEEKVFDLLSEVNLGGESRAFHSLNCSEHQYKIWSEIDFLVMGEKGIFILEVKGGRIEFKNGLWHFTDRFDRSNTSSEGPFNQAKSAMFSLRDMLRDRYEIEAVLTNRILFGFGVVFPHIPWAEDTTEMPRQVVADRSQCKDARSLEKYLTGLQHYWANKGGKKGKISTSDLKALQSKMRPDVDVYPPFSVRLGQAIERMNHLTEEQYERLDIIDANERVLITGGAGTGKTFLLMQCARRERSKGRIVQIVVENPVLAAHLRSMEADSGIRISHYSKLKPAKNLADVLLVDEGQDLLTLDILDALSGQLKGGLDEGCWRWFMDANNQAHVGGKFNEDALQYLRMGLSTGRPVEIPLTKNVRNTKEIAEKIQLWLGAELGKAELTGHGSPPRVVVVSDDDYISKLIETVYKLIEEGADAEDVGIILATGMASKWIDRLPQNIRRLCVPLDVNTVRAALRGKMVWGRAKDFKGLDRPIILAVGFEGIEYLSTACSEFYVALTRCNYALWLFTDKKLKSSLDRNAEANRALLGGDGND